MRPHRVAFVVTLALVQAYFAVAGISVASLLSTEPSGQADPAPALRRPVITAGPVLTPASPGSAGGYGSLAQRLLSSLASRNLQSSIGVAVTDATTGRRLVRNRADIAATPASTTKIVTATAALATLGPDARLRTRVVRGESADAVVLVGGGDPTLAGPGITTSYPKYASLAGLAATTARALRAAGIRSVLLHYDDSAYVGPRLGPGWSTGYVTGGHVSPVSALQVNSGRLRPLTDDANPEPSPRTWDPSRMAAVTFAKALATRGVSVRGEIRRIRSSASGVELASVSSPPVAALVEHMLTVSDNDLAEALARQVAIAQGHPGSFSGAAAALREVLSRFGLDRGIQVYDGSGLSRLNRITPDALASLLRFAASPQRPALRAVVSGLPVANFTGTLADRFDSGHVRQGAGMVRAKTGTLSGVSSLAGVAVGPDGQLLAFAFMADRVPASGTETARTVLDQLAATLVV